MSPTTGSVDGEEPRRPVLRVVRGDASAEEVAALVAVLGALGGRTQSHRADEPSAWTDRRAMVRDVLPHGPGAWRTSFWPR